MSFPHSTPLPPVSERLHGLDALRALALLLGVSLHASMSFLPGAQYFWVVADTQSSTSIGLLFFVPHMFRMILFFLLAGFFGRLLRERVGTIEFIRDRARRIGLPLVAGWVPMLVAITAVLAWSAWIANGGSMPTQSPPPPKFTPSDFPLTHLWFLYELLLCYGALMLVRAAGTLIDRHARIAGVLDRVVRFCLHPLGMALLAIPLALAFLQQPHWYAWFGIPTPDQTLYPNLPVLASYWLAFALGWLLHRQQGLFDGLRKRWSLHLGIAVVLTATCLWIIGGTAPVLVEAKHDARDICYAVFYALAAWQWTFGLVGAGLRFCAGHSPARRYLADASYWIYIGHLPLIMALQVAFRNVGWSPWLECLAILAITFGLLLASYDLFVRSTFLGAILNGRRRPRALANFASRGATDASSTTQ